MNYPGLIAELQSHIEQNFIDSGQHLPYHNLDHTRAVLNASIELANHYQLGDEDRFIVNAAALFHDLGILFTGIPGHEKKSGEMAEKWLLGKGVPVQVIDKVKACIMATRLPQCPENLNEQIVADSDLWHLGTGQFTPNQKLLRQELSATEGKVIEIQTWRERNIALLSAHRFHTDYAKGLLQYKKDEHLSRLKKKLEKEQKATANKETGHKKAKKDKDPNIPTRGIETMFRVTIHNHLELSSMADSKANIMISVNSIIVSVVLSVLLRKFGESPEIILPTCILLTVNILTIVFAILAVRPKIMGSKASGSNDDAGPKKPNLLFFGSFNKMSLDLYTRKMKDMMREKDYLYENMINNIYFMGIVLGRKYHWLRVAYNVFMYGFILAIFSFTAAILWANYNAAP